MPSRASGIRLWPIGCVVLALTLSVHLASAQSIKIGVIGEEFSVASASLTKSAVMAADDINARGGVSGRKIEIITYDNHSSAADFGTRLPTRGERGQGGRDRR